MDRSGTIAGDLWGGLAAMLVALPSAIASIFRLGDTGDELFLVRRGAVRILLPLGGEQEHHLATFGRGNFFGEMAFLDRAPRSANAVAYNDVELFMLSRQRFDALAGQHRHLALNLLEALARSRSACATPTPS
ncbi:MAG: cyclic nucleotide-binding domain-containing protein [Betaproteobacteria bacterium]|nr:cyclic nucleotide-binding domain-containing protein [Betaproteobacteria bacterium]